MRTRKAVASDNLSVAVFELERLGNEIRRAAVAEYDVENGITAFVGRREFDFYVPAANRAANVVFVIRFALVFERAFFDLVFLRLLRFSSLSIS